MNEMAQRVAKAVDALVRSQIVFDGPTVHVRIDAPAIARAAIEAMREPTTAMIEAGGRSLPYSAGNSTEDAEDVWRDMIDAALKERASTPEPPSRSPGAPR